MKDEILIYSGNFFTVEWYLDERGFSPACHYYQSQTLTQRVKFMRLVKLIADMGKILDPSKFRNEGDQIYAFKPQPDRYMCFFMNGQKIIVTNAFCKKSQKLPVLEKKRATRYRESFLARNSRGIYYEKNS